MRKLLNKIGYECEDCKVVYYNGVIIKITPYPMILCNKHYREYVKGNPDKYGVYKNKEDD